METGGIAPQPGPGRSMSAWWTTTTAIAAALVIALAALGLLWLLARPLTLLALGIVIASALAPVVNWLGRRLPRVAAVVVAYLVVLLVLGGIGWIVLPTVARQGVAFVERAPDLLNRAQLWLRRFPGVDPETITEAITSQLGQVSSALLALPVALVSSVLDLVFIVFLSIYWLLESSERHAFVLSLFPGHRRSGVADLLSDVGQAMGGFVRGTVIDGAIVGVLSYLGLTIIGVDFALVLALTAGVLEVLPILGPVLASIPMLLVALSESVTQAAIVLAFILALQQLESNVLLPNIMRSQTAVSPLISLLAVFVGGALGGLVGALAAIPLAAALRVIILRVVAPLLRRWTGAEAQPPGTTTEPGSEDGK